MHDLRAVLFWTAGLLIGTQGSCGAARPQTAENRPSESQDSASDKKEAQDSKKKSVPAKLDTSTAPSFSDHSLRGLARDFLIDQKTIWTSPAHLRLSDADWLVPASGLAAGLFSTDSDFSRHLSHNPQTISHNKTYSNAGIAALVGGAGGMFLLSYPAHNEHWRETGFLAGEAAVASLIPIEIMKYSLRRQRPFEGDGTGPFFKGGTSFPSEHAAAAWAVAGVIAHEYPGALPKLAAYGLASFVTYARLRGRQHFPSDVFIGSMIGQLVAQNVYQRHHDPGLGGEEWRSIGEIVRGDGYRSAANQGSPYVPLDSWIYPALDRLAAMGAIDSGFAGMRPWTRLECARLVNEAADALGFDDNAGGENRTVDTLLKEFEQEIGDMDGGINETLRLESVYSRTENISGTPLTNGYTFGQTQINDFGRPYGEGWNSVNGASIYLTHGRWVGYVRGELQTAAGIPALSLSTREIVQQTNFYPVLPSANAQSASTRFQLLDAYAGLMLSNWEITFGKQSLWWGPGDGGPMMLSNNAAPINMFRINRVTPIKLPSVLGWLGPMRLEWFLGQLTGYQFVFSPSPVGFTGQNGQTVNPQPFIHGQKISFKPTSNFEFGVFRTTVYGGPGYPFTAHTFLRSLFSTSNENVTSTGGSAIKPGDRRSGVDFSYRLPGLRRWVTFYGDGFVDDQFSPIGYFDRSAWHAGLYFSQFPGIPKLDLRVEGVYTDNPLGGNLGHGFYYFNFTWRSGYTNAGNLIGSWIGREGQGAQGWSNYWFNARNRVQFNFRHQKVSQEFIPGGGTLTDVGVRGDYWFRSNLSLSTSVQYERWIFPVIRPGAQRDVTGSVEILFQPQKMLRRGAGNVIDSPSENGAPE